MRKAALAGLAASMAAAAPAAQIVLTPVAVYASTGQYLQGFPATTFAPGNILNQQTGPINETAQDGSYWINPDNGPANASISIDLGGTYRLSSFDLFNTHNAQYNDRGTGNFSIVGSNDATFAIFTTLASGTLTAEQQGTPLTAQSFASGSTGVFRYLQFRPTSVASANAPCCGANVYGLNELRVFGTAGVVPEPGQWALLIAGFGAVGYTLRRRRVRFAAA